MKSWKRLAHASPFVTEVPASAMNAALISSFEWKRLPGRRARYLKKSSGFAKGFSYAVPFESFVGMSVLMFGTLAAARAARIVSASSRPRRRTS
jgi:hypothetical protein